MRSMLRLGAALAASTAATAGGAAALAETVNEKPVKGATYAATFQQRDTLTVKVAKNGKTATVKLPFAPIFCASGGGGGAPHSVSSPGTISKQGALSVKITYFPIAGATTPFATATVHGNFLTFKGSKPVFDGFAKVTYTAAKQCDGQESFQAIKH